MGRLAVYKFAYFLSILFTIFILGLSIFAYFSGKINPVENMFAAFSLLDKEDRYKAKMQEIIHRRLHALWDSTGFTLIEDPLRAGYYSEIDMLVWAKKFYGDEFADYLQKTYNPLDVVFRLANETSLVLLNGGGFAGPKWSVRVSLANLNEADYVKIGQSIKRVLDEYAENR